MGRIKTHNEYTANHLTTNEITEAFGDTLQSIYRTKKNELDHLIFPYYEKLDLINASEYSDDDKNLMRMLLRSCYKQELTAVEHIRKVRNMHIRNKQGRMSVMPLEEIKLIPIMDVFEFKAVKRTGRRTMVACPLHIDSTPSMIINLNNTWKCFSCQKSGSVVDLVMEVYGFDFVTAAKHLQNGGMYGKVK